MSVPYFIRHTHSIEHTVQVFILISGKIRLFLCLLIANNNYWYLML